MAQGRRGGKAFTVAVPRELPAERQGEHWWVELDGRRLRLSNLDKVFWPDEGYTKGDLLAYYYNAAPDMAPFLEERPLTMKRMPDGVAGPHFYEKQAPSHTPAWMPRCAVLHGDTDAGVIEYLVATLPSEILFVANLGCIEFHPLHSRCSTIDEPDYVFFDLDPFEPATYEDVCIVALHVRAALKALGIECYPKTSGATGMQIYVGLAPGHTYEQTRALVGAVGRYILRADPDRVTMDWVVDKRTGKIFIDHNMNRRGANISAVYSVRPEPGASVSTPLSWEEIEAGGLHPSQFTIADVHGDREARRALFEPMLHQGVDIRPALQALGVNPDAVPADEDAPARRPRWRPRRDARDSTAEPLAEYRRKRDFDKTPEPPPAEPSAPGNRFVIQKHDATRLHFDLRLERDGVLVSWAVPRGLPTEKGERRLAVQTEDHPLEYASFEGAIPKGEYGGGDVVVFDSGTYTLHEWTDKKVTFTLHGNRYRGEYHMVRTRENWLILLSKTAEEHVPPPAFEPMLADPGHAPFDDPAFRFEPKLDGIRTLAYVNTHGTRLLSRTSRDQTAQYPELNNLATWMNCREAVVDGEIVALDAESRPSFQRLQQRMNLTNERDIDRVRRIVPVTLYLFDILWLDGESLIGLPLTERRERLERVVTESQTLRLTAYVDGQGRGLFEAARRLGLEGAIGKRLTSVYEPGRRSKDWRKIKATKRQDCVILGWLPGAGSLEASFGALLVGAYDEGVLRLVGQIGTGFTHAMRRRIREELEPLERPDPAFEDAETRRHEQARWVSPELVCEVEYLELTSGGRMRAPSFKGMRQDKTPAQCRLGEA